VNDARAHLRFWPEGVPHTMAVPRTTLPQALADTAARNASKPAIIYGGAATNYAQLARRVDALAGYLQHLGVATGDRVLLVGQNGPQWVTAAYAVMRAGAVLVPVSPMSKAAEIAFYAQNSGARVAIVAQEALSELPLGNEAGPISLAVVWAYAEQIAPELAAAGNTELPDWVRAPLRPLNDARLHAFEAAIAARLQPGTMPADPDELAVLPYTSGTTGQPKACMHTHATLLAALVTSAAWKPVRPDSVVLTVAPLFHMLGLQNGMNLPILQGATSVMMPRWHAATAAALMERYRVTVWSAPPAMIIDLFAEPGTAQRDLSSLQTLTGGGAAMPEAVAAMLLERYGLRYQEGYGLSETASFLHANPPQRGKRQCLGMPTPNVDSRIIDPASLVELPPGEVGELVTDAPQVMRGYWRNAAADKLAFVELEGRRYFRTGDLALVDEDGYFFMKDRLKRMINVSGYKVWPAEVESAMYAHPAVHEACVIGIPDAKSGEAVKALVALKPDFQGRITPEELVAWCREQMAVYKAPRHIEFIESLPKSNTGKIMWRELQQANQQPRSNP
jgi:fatty-acyl-CoA synthase